MKTKYSQISTIFLNVKKETNQKEKRKMKMTNTNRSKQAKKGKKKKEKKNQPEKHSRKILKPEILLLSTHEQA